LGAADCRPTDARPVLNGLLPEVVAYRCGPASQVRDEGVTFLIYIEDITRGEIRLTSWNSFFSLELFQDRDAHGVATGLRVREEYPGSVLGNLHDFSAFGNWIQQRLDPDVVMIHISIRGTGLFIYFLVFQNQKQFVNV
jgi:hypothetical protein